ncbi:MAG TPA: S8 family serine peptidase [Bradyrhizobium sp.]|uniref:S8 family serine peptidase n=1 Tax=Bradyrhizobium sp. TaxID=376 RepID=UPI002D7F034C|nr:S8 family serine peptidase [Bradyrhizobium sp.]HET7886341.1 S8 family serine peptidase [Bradyrhizobium sp.]
MFTKYKFVLAAVFLAALPAAAAAEDMLEPPVNKYFLSKGAWGQDYPDQWALSHIGFDNSANSAWRLVRRNAQPVIVAVIDTGLDWNHRNIDWENIWRNSRASPAKAELDNYADDVIGWDFFDRDNKPWDFDGHGTMVAGIIAGSWKDKDGMAGVNPFARLMILKAVNNFGVTRASFLAEAIAYAADHGARVINLSVGGKGSAQVAKEAIDYAYAKGAVIVVAAGNDGAEIKDYGIAMSEKILLVGATGFDDQRMGFSNWGNISVAAPGLEILSLRARRTDTMLGIEGVKYVPGANFVGEDKRYYHASGTSFAAPLVSGLASLMIANDPTLTNRQVMNIIKSTARDVGTPGVDQFTGYGLIDARAALKAARDYRLLVNIAAVESATAGGKQVARVRGTADADDLKSARLEIGAGESPTAWVPIGPVSRCDAVDCVLGDVPVAKLSGAKLWQIRVIVEHSNGSTREMRFRLSLG